MRPTPSETEERMKAMQRNQAAQRVQGLIKLEAAMQLAYQARAEIYNNMPANHPARQWLLDVKRAIYADKDGGTSLDGTLFTLADNLELVSRLE